MHYSKYGTLAGKVVDDGEVYMVNDTSRGHSLQIPFYIKRELNHAWRSR